MSRGAAARRLLRPRARAPTDDPRTAATARAPRHPPRPSSSPAGRRVDADTARTPADAAQTRRAGCPRRDRSVRRTSGDPLARLVAEQLLQVAQRVKEIRL